MQGFQVIEIKQNNGQIILSLVDATGQTISGQINLEELIRMNDQIIKILDPQKEIKDRLKELKRFRREAYFHFRQEQDPKLREQRKEFYIETTRLVKELEEGLTNGS